MNARVQREMAAVALPAAAAAAAATPATVCWLSCCCLLVGDILMMKIGLAPGNSMHLITGSNLTILMPLPPLALFLSYLVVGVGRGKNGGREKNSIKLPNVWLQSSPSMWSLREISQRHLAQHSTLLLLTPMRHFVFATCG